ncbi:TPA: Asp-tRNA(Asn)/Glu-tRNA(Gln) amidotransferase GatCAB subunit A [Candidatus Uhrbacteria bacterium]|nr:Asp-tRNA(Asn)/Glu-tRNA(Gln) amidotransferase GatCAB subunit A [Candidatus Uhrbacteria bacterium]
MTFSTIQSIIDEIKSGRTSATAIVEATLADIKARDGALGAFLETFDADALAQAAAIDALVKNAKENGGELPPLAGVPVAIKDNMLYTGHKATACSKILAEHTATYNSTVVERLIAAGAIIIGRTNMDDAAMGSSTETSAWQKTYNPWNITKIPGGSSGGSAVAVAAGFVPVALGSDTGGSVRQPAAMCGVVGVKPSYGRVSRYGIIALGSSLDQVGVFSHTASDAALILSVIGGRDEHDATSVEKAWGVIGEPSMNGLRVGVPKEYFVDGMDEEVRSRISEAIELMKQAGAEIVDLSLPLTPFALPTYYIIQPAEASSNLGRYDGMRYGTRAPGSLEESYINARGQGFGPEVKRRIMLGTFILSAGYYDSYYKKALAVRTAIRAEFDDAFKHVDVILSPTAPGVAWNMGEKMNDPVAMYLADIFTVAANIAGIAGISIPCGFAHNLPVGLQFLAGSMQDEKALQAAAAYQSITSWHDQHPVV